MTPRRDPYVRGYRAAINGLPRWSNPLPNGSTARENWDAGWTSALRSLKYPPPPTYGLSPKTQTPP